MPYLMEASTEGVRLRTQEHSCPSLERLAAAGLARGMRVADVGCGSGATLSSLLDLVGPEGSVVAVEPNAERLAEAGALGDGRVELIQAALPRTGLPDASVDFAWCQFVFEYLPEPRAALDELIRITRPGGKVVVSDVDGLGKSMWPLPASVQEGSPLLWRSLARTGFDPDVGRKMLHLFHQAGLEHLHVRLWPLHVTAGAADARLLEDWRQRFQLIAPVAAPEFGGPDAFGRFCNDYLDALAAPDVLKYNVVLVTEGVRR